MIGDLPEEIVEDIISILFTPGLSKTNSQSSSSKQWSPLTILYTSKQFNRIATPFLYANVTLHHPAQPELLARTLKEHPYLLVKIRALKIEAPFSGLGSLASVLAKIKARMVTPGLKLDALDITLDHARNVFASSRPSSPEMSMVHTPSAPSGHSRSQSLSQPSSSSSGSPLADVTVGLTAFITQVISVRHLALRKHGYLTHPGTRRVIECLSDVTRSWHELETVDFKFAPAPLPTSSNPATNLTVIQPPFVTGRSRGQSLGSSRPSLSANGDRWRSSNASFAPSSSASASASAISIVSSVNPLPSSNPYAFAHTLSRLPSLRAVRAIRPAVWNDFLQIVSENRRLERIVLVNPGEDEYTDTRGQKRGGYEEHEYDLARSRVESEWSSQSTGGGNVTAKGKARERTPSPPFPRRASESAFSSPYQTHSGSSSTGWAGPSSWSSASHNSPLSSPHDTEFDTKLELPGSDLFTSHAAANHPRLHMLISEGRKWKWRINFVQVRERQKSTSGSAYSNMGADPKWRSRAHTYSDSSVTIAPPSPHSFSKPLSQSSASLVSSKTAGVAKPISFSTPPRSRPSQTQSRGTTSPPPSSFNYHHLSSASSTHYSTSSRPHFTQSQTLTYAMNGYRT